MTLRDFRLRANLGYPEVAAYVSAQTERPYRPGTVILWEHRGIKKADVLVALAVLYCASMEEIINAAKLSAAKKGPLQKRGPKSKKLLLKV